jgi:hypothetical protein
MAVLSASLGVHRGTRRSRRALIRRVRRRVVGRIARDARRVPKAVMRATVVRFCRRGRPMRSSSIGRAGATAGVSLC